MEKMPINLCLQLSNRPLQALKEHTSQMFKAAEQFIADANKKGQTRGWGKYKSMQIVELFQGLQNMF